MRREAPKDVPCSQRLAQHLSLAGLEAIVPAQPRGKARWGQCRAGCAPAAWGWQVLAVSSSGPLRIGLALHPCSLQHRTTGPGEAVL